MTIIIIIKKEEKHYLKISFLQQKKTQNKEDKEPK